MGRKGNLSSIFFEVIEMAKKKINKTNAIRMVEQAKIPYRLHEYAWHEDHLDARTAAKNGSLPIEKVFKTLLIEGNNTGPIVVCIPALAEIDLKALASASGNKRTELLPLGDLEKTTGYIRGGTSPIGMKKLYPTFIAQEAEGMETIIVSAGKRGMQIELNPLDLKELTEAKFVAVTAKIN